MSNQLPPGFVPSSGSPGGATAPLNPAPGNGGGSANGQQSPTVPAPAANAPLCQPWQIPSPGPQVAPIWAIGCVSSTTGLQCSPNGPVSDTPSCSIPNWNSQCEQNVLWELRPPPNAPAGSVQTVPVYGCVGASASLAGMRCPKSGSTSRDPLVPINIDTMCQGGPNTTTTDASAATATSAASTSTSTAVVANSSPKSAAPSSPSAKHSLLSVLMMVLVFTSTQLWA
ncbi:hypothetical protein RI367_005660 [Sorochytrium milnesiophthora]